MYSNELDWGFFFFFFCKLFKHKLMTTSLAENELVIDINFLESLENMKGIRNTNTML